MQTTQWFTSVQIAVKILNTTWMPTLLMLPNGWTTTIRPYTPKSKFVLFGGDSRLKTCQGIKLVNDHEKKFPAFARSWGFEKVTSSPKLPKVSKEYPALLHWRRTTTEAIPRIRSRSYPTRQFLQKFLERLPGVDAPALEALAAGASAWWNLVLGCTGGTGETSKDRRTTPSESAGCSWGKAYNSWEQPDSELLRNQQRVAHHTT